MDVAETIRARRAELAARLELGQAEYQQIEQMLAQLQRNLDAMHGGIQELDAVLAAIEQGDNPPCNDDSPSSSAC